MKLFKYISLLAILAMLMVAVGPAYAQLGETDISSFTIQNIDSYDATVTVYFYTEGGSEVKPNLLNPNASEPGGYQPNPFTLGPGESWEIYLPAIPDTELPDGRYSVVIESTARVVAIANLLGEGASYFNGSYSGFDAGAPTFYLPGVVFNYYGWYSLISVQNTGDAAANVTVTITCENGAIGTLTYSGIPVNSSHHFDLETTTPTGFTSTTTCNGAAVISSNVDVVVVDNQTHPATGKTQSYGGVMNGSPTVYIPALYQAYYGWVASINIQKLNAGNTTVTVEYSDGAPSSTCNLTDLKPACLLYMPSVHPASSTPFAATITNSANFDLMVIANAANNRQAQTYNGVVVGTDSVGIPSVMKSYYGWNTSFTCQNLGIADVDLNIVYTGYEAYGYTFNNLPPGGTKEFYTPLESFLPAGARTSVTVTADSGAEVACIVNFTNPNSIITKPGDWSMSYNAFNQ